MQAAPTYRITVVAPSGVMGGMSEIDWVFWRMYWRQDDMLVAVAAAGVAGPVVMLKQFCVAVSSQRRKS